MDRYTLNITDTFGSKMPEGTNLFISARIIEKGSSFTIEGPGVLIGYDRHNRMVVEIEGRFAESVFNACDVGVEHIYSARKARL